MQALRQCARHRQDLVPAALAPQDAHGLLGDRTLVAGIVDVPAMHAALAVVQVHAGAVEVATAGGDLGEHHIGRHDVRTRTAAQTLQRRLHGGFAFAQTALQQVQLALQQQHAADYRARLVIADRHPRHVALQQRFGEAELSLQDHQPQPFDIDQQLGIQATLATSQFDGFLQALPGLLQLAAGHRDARQGHVAEDGRQPVARGQPGQGVPTVLSGQLGIAAQALQVAVQRLPVGQQPGISRGLRQRHEPSQVLQALLRFIQAATEQQGPGTETEQPRGALQQVGRHLVEPADEQAQMVLVQQPLQLQPLHVAGGNFRLAGFERQFDRLVHVPAHAQQPAGTQTQAIQFRGRQVALQRMRHQRQQPIPLALPIDRSEECLELQQTLENQAAALLFPQLGTQLGGKLRQMRQALQDLALRLAHAGQQLMLQILVHQRHGRRATLPQQDADTHAPALRAPPEVGAGGAIHAWGEAVEQGFEFIAGESQLPGIQFEQLAPQHQARQVPVGPLPAGDQQLHIARRQCQQAFDPVIRIGRHFARKVVQHQAHRRVTGGQGIQQRLRIGSPGVRRVQLRRDTGTQFLQRNGFPGQVHPDDFSRAGTA
ncbi:hypothetical protein D3C78_699970 [compost metagenome]